MESVRSGVSRLSVPESGWAVWPHAARHDIQPVVQLHLASSYFILD